jgi:hypothetical protein
MLYCLIALVPAEAPLHVSVTFIVVVRLPAWRETGGRSWKRVSSGQYSDTSSGVIRAACSTPCSHLKTDGSSLA